MRSDSAQLLLIVPKFRVGTHSSSPSAHLMGRRGNAEGKASTVDGYGHPPYLLAHAEAADTSNTATLSRVSSLWS